MSPMNQRSRELLPGSRRVPSLGRSQLGDRVRKKFRDAKVPSKVWRPKDIRDCIGWVDVEDPAVGSGRGSPVGVVGPEVADGHNGVDSCGGNNSVFEHLKGRRRDWECVSCGQLVSSWRVVCKDCGWDQRAMRMPARGWKTSGGIDGRGRVGITDDINGYMGRTDEVERNSRDKLHSRKGVCEWRHKVGFSENGECVCQDDSYGARGLMEQAGRDAAGARGSRGSAGIAAKVGRPARRQLEWRQKYVAENAAEGAPEGSAEGRAEGIAEGAADDAADGDAENVDAIRCRMVPSTYDDLHCPPVTGRGREQVGNQEHLARGDRPLRRSTGRGPSRGPQRGSRRSAGSAQCNDCPATTGATATTTGTNSLRHGAAVPVP